ncbi:hypothetical protein B5X24_HaOG203950 [Helicoverpa armigera]|uniref:FLYWCH-type domain-containing protein n=1 Tax=Helicoverpa armigera TaxID=29058 RepID=A0A2W1BPM0_HELAM|nr:hypothetical protein B5X24_HaOG203950 [Helicoverpa armigera]
MDPSNNIEDAILDHSHPPPKYHVHNGVKYIKSTRGHPLLLHKSYRYTFASVSHSKGTSRWICTSHFQHNCKAKIWLNTKQNIVEGPTILEHTHSPPKHLSDTGEFTPIKL